MEHNQPPAGSEIDRGSSETQDPAQLWPVNPYAGFVSRLPASEIVGLATDFRHQLPPQGSFLIEGITYYPQAFIDTQGVPIASLAEPPRFQAYPFIEEVGNSSFAENPVPWPVAHSPPAGRGNIQDIASIVSNNAGEVGLSAPPGSGPQSSFIAGFIDVAGSDTSSYIEPLLQSPENTIATGATISQNFYTPIENPPQQATDNLPDGEVRPGKELCRETGKKHRQLHRPFPQHPQGIRQSKITRSPSRKPSKTRALSKPALEKLFQDEMGNLQGVMQVFGAKQRLRSAPTEENKTSTAATRQMHACIRCRKLKKRCIPGETPDGPCKGCRVAKPYILKMPCARATIIEAALFRLRPPEDDPLRNWTRRPHVFALKDEKALLARPRQIQLTQDMGVVLTVSVGVFTPGPGDRTGYTWEDKHGILHTMEMPHFYIVNYSEAKANMMQYIESSRQHHLDNLLDPSNEILWETFQMAIDMGHLGNSLMLKQALNLWSACRIIERLWRICGDDQLGLDVIWDKENPWNGIIPITPIMDPQLDQLVIQGYLIPLKSHLLQELHAKMREKSKEDWFEIYLTIFVLLSNTEQMLAHTRRFARRFGMSGRFGPSGCYSIAESYFFACNIMLTHFHFVYSGGPLLNLDWTSPDVSRCAALTFDQVRYLERLKVLIREKQEKLIELRSRSKYETNLYWCHQLLFDGWVPHPLSIKEVDPSDDSPV